MSWNFQANGHFRGDDAPEKEQHLIDRLNEVINEFRVEGFEDAVSYATFIGSFTSPLFLNADTGRLQ